MKDALELKDYRAKFKRYYDIEFGSDYDIHHIDLNHNNDDIDNLMVVPKNIHKKYHEYLYGIEFMSEGNGLERVFRFNARPTGNGSAFNYFAYENLSKFMGIMQGMNDWYDYKLYLDGHIPNIHGINLERKNRESLWR